MKQITEAVVTPRPIDRYLSFMSRFITNRGIFSFAARSPDAGKDLFSRYQNFVREQQTVAECLLFQNSFRLGAKMVPEVTEQ